MTPEELKAARHALGMSANGFASWLKVANGRTVRRWEAGDSDIPGPVQVLVRAALASEGVRDYFGLTIRQDART